MGFLNSKNNDELEENVQEKTEYTDIAPEDIPEDELRREIDEIQAKLKIDAPELLTEAMVDPEKVKELSETLLHDPEFNEFHSYNNPKVTKQYVAEIAGFGVIDRLLQNDKSITDIAWNGNFLVIETPDEKKVYKGRDQNQIDDVYIQRIINRFTSKEDSGNGVPFDESHPHFEGASKNLRVDAIHGSLTPNGKTTLSLRVSRPKLALNEDNFNYFAPAWILKFLQTVVKSHMNVTIAGETGTGKTELQKLMIKWIPFVDRIIMIEDVNETHLKKLYPKKDIMEWLTNGQVTISDEIKAALRNNPKWIMVSETRGEEANQMFQAVMSGQSIITTMHSLSNDATPSRFIGMASQSKSNINIDMLHDDFLNFFHLGMHISAKINHNHKYRYLDSISEFVPVDKEHPYGTNEIFHQDLFFKEDGTPYRQYSVGTPSDKMLSKISSELNGAQLQLPWSDRPIFEKLSYKDDTDILYIPNTFDLANEANKEANKKFNEANEEANKKSNSLKKNEQKVSNQKKVKLANKKPNDAKKAFKITNKMQKKGKSN